MDLSMPSPTYPRSGRGGDWWGFAKLNHKMPHPFWTMLLYKSLTNPHITRWELVGGLTLNFVQKQYKYPPNIVRHIAGMQRTFYTFANAPTLGTILCDNPLLIPTRCLTWGRWLDIDRCINDGCGRSLTFQRHVKLASVAFFCLRWHPPWRKSFTS